MMATRKATTVSKCLWTARACWGLFTNSQTRGRGKERKREGEGGGAEKGDERERDRHSFLYLYFFVLSCLVSLIVV
jgi:hypothetical protein